MGQTSVGEYLVLNRKPSSQDWRTFLENHVKIKVPYGHEFREIEVPESNQAFVAGPKQVPPLTYVGAAVASAIRHPIGSPSLADLVARHGKRTLILVDDSTRSTPHFAEALDRPLARQGCPAQIGVVTAGADVIARFGSQRSVQHA